MAEASSLNAVNYLNLVGYIINAAVAYSIGLLGLFGFSSNSEVSRAYQTIITPVGWAFSVIWTIIFLSQAIFTIAQLLPTFRGDALVQKGVSCYYWATCICQILWVFSFATERISISLVAMLSVLVSLVLLVNSQYRNQSETTPWREYLLLRFPFEIHCGWITVASFVNISLVLVAWEVSSKVEAFVGALSLVVLLVVALGVLVRPSPPVYIIALVIWWATLGVWSELGSPGDSIEERFGDGDIRNIRRGAGFVSVAAQVLTIARFAFLRIRGGATTEDGEENGAYVNAGKRRTPLINLA